MSPLRAPLATAGCAFVFLLVLTSMVPAKGQEVPAVSLYVNDLASPGALLSFEEDKLDSLCYEIDYRTSAEVAILVVNTTLPMGIDEFAFRTFEQNVIGKEGKDNGILIIVTTDEGAWRIEVGYGLEGLLPDSKVARFARDYLEPGIAAFDYYQGLYDVTFELGNEILNSGEGTSGGNPQPWIYDWRGIAVGFVVLMVVGVVTRGRVFLWVGNVLKRGGFGGGRSGGGGASGR